MPSRPHVRAAVLAAAAVAVAAGAAAPARAATVQLDAGATTLALDKRTARTLRAVGVSVTPVAPARSSRDGLVLPITGGRIDPATAAGEIPHAGALQLRRGAARLRLTRVVVRAGSARAVSVRAGGRRLDAFSLAVRRATLRRRGFATTLADVPVRLTADGAAALNRALRVTAFRPGGRFGVATVRSLPAEIAFEGGATTLAVDPAAAGAFQSAGVAVAPLGPAFANPDGTLAFPIARGKVNAKTLAGSVSHRGGLVFSRGATTLVVDAPILYTSGLPRLTAGLGGRRGDFLALDVANVVETSAGLTETLAGMVARLTPDGAATLNQAFGTTAFAAGQVLGTMTLAAQVA